MKRVAISAHVSKDASKVMDFYCTLKGKQKCELIEEAIIHYIRKIWHTEFDDEDRAYIKKKLNLSNEFVDLLEKGGDTNDNQV